jgi:hypothetical protein
MRNVSKKFKNHNTEDFSILISELYERLMSLLRTYHCITPALKRMLSFGT